MFDDFEIDWTIAGVSIIAWAFTLLPVWGNLPFFNFGKEVMRIHIRIIYTIVMLPLCYIIVSAISNQG